jgi:hypothetical protein
MQVYAATLAQLVHDGAKLALIFADRGGPQLAAAAESRVVKSGQGKQRSRKKLKELINYGREY